MMKKEYLENKALSYWWTIYLKINKDHEKYYDKFKNDIIYYLRT